MKKERIWLIIIGAILFLAVISSFLINQIHSDHKIASISVGGKVVKTIDLDKVTDSYTFKLKGKNGGYNVIKVDKGSIAIVEADCPDQVCVHQGKITDGIKPIVCLPHELVIKINGETIEHHHDDESAHQIDTISK